MSAASSRRRYLSVWLRRLATDRLIRSLSPAPAEEAPLVIVAPIASALRLAAVNDAAARLGLKAGMALADARAMYPGLEAADADAAADRRLLEAIADWCDRYTPLVGLDPPDGLVLDIAGCAHLFGGEEALCRDIVRRLALQGLHAGAAVADTVGAASAVARYGTVRVVTSGRTREALLALPVAALRIAPDTAAALAQTGLKRIANVIDRPRAPLAARFGMNFIRRIDQALGHEDEPIAPRLPIAPYVAERRFAEPILLEADVLGNIEHLAQELARLLQRRGEGARRLQLALFRVDGKVHRIEVGTSTPLREPARIRALFTERLAAVGDACDPGFGFDVVRLSALATEPQAPTQTGLVAPDHAEELAHLIDRLGARFGQHRVARLLPQDSHIPEYAVGTVPAHEAKLPSPREYLRAAGRGRWWDDFCGQEPPTPALTDLGLARVRHHKWPKSDKSDLGLPTLPATSLHSVGGRYSTAPSRPESQDNGSEFEQDSLAPTRPLRLFVQPEPIEAIAEVPDGPPVRFRWRRVLHEVARAEGPERIAMQWWRDAQGRALTRDYFRVESRDGVRLWLYREGLYGRETREPRWFLHGLLA